MPLIICQSLRLHHNRVGYDSERLIQSVQGLVGIR
jgi:hypothetical protein